MSENLKTTEANINSEHHISHSKPEKKENVANNSEMGDTEDSLAAARRTISKEAIDSESVVIGDSSPKVTATISPNSRKQNYTKALSGIRVHLNPAERTFSKIIHQPIIEKASDIGAASIGRSSGFLVGSIVALVGSALLLIISKRSGFSYSYFVFGALYVGGYFVGVLSELLYRLLAKPKA